MPLFVGSKGHATVSVRYGAYLRAIPPANRFGDYVHCTGRVVNIFFKRLVPVLHHYHQDMQRWSGKDIDIDN